MAKELTGEVLARVKSNGWHWLKIFGPAEDQYGHEMADGTYYEPTFKKSFQIAGLRTDGEYFQVNVIFEPDEIDMKVLRLIGSKLENALLVFEQFRTCPCTVEQACEKHRA